MAVHLHISGVHEHCESGLEDTEDGLDEIFNPWEISMILGFFVCIVIHKSVYVWPQFMLSEPGSIQTIWWYLFYMEHAPDFSRRWSDVAW